MLVLPLGLEQDQQTLAAIFSLTIILWITEAIPIPVAGVVGVALCVLLGVAAEDEVFGAFASSTVFLFIGGFVIAKAMSVHGLDRRFALRVLAVPGVGASTRRTVIAFGIISMAVSAFISNTAAVAMLFPIALGIVASIASLSGGGMEERRRERALGVRHRGDADGRLRREHRRPADADRRAAPADRARPRRRRRPASA